MNHFRSLLDTPYGELDKKQEQPSLGNLYSPVGLGGMGTDLLLLIDRRTTRKRVIIDGRLDDESKKIIDTFNATLERVFLSQATANLQHLDYGKSADDRYDFSQLVTSLGKVFEIELNSSVIQWIRHFNGIEMPQYYREVKEGVELVQYIGTKRVDLNQYRSGDDRRLKPVMFGDALALTGKYLNDLPGYLRETTRELLGVWRNIKDERNASAHTEIISEQRFIDFYNKYCAVVEAEVFTQLMDLKDEMQGK